MDWKQLFNWMAQGFPHMVSRWLTKNSVAEEIAKPRLEKAWYALIGLSVGLAVWGFWLPLALVVGMMIIGMGYKANGVLGDWLDEPR